MSLNLLCITAITIEMNLAWREYLSSNTTNILFGVEGLLRAGDI
jgi:hypothetical protein